MKNFKIKDLMITVPPVKMQGDENMKTKANSNHPDFYDHVIYAGCDSKSDCSSTSPICAETKSECSSTSPDCVRTDCTSTSPDCKPTNCSSTSPDCVRTDCTSTSPDCAESKSECSSTSPLCAGLSSCSISTPEKQILGIHHLNNNEADLTTSKLLMELKQSLIEMQSKKVETAA